MRGSRFTDYAGRGVHAARRAVSAARQAPDRQAPDQQPPDEQSPDDLVRVRTRLKKTRAKLGDSAAEVERLKGELRSTRASLRDPVPGIELPEVVRQTISQAREEKITYLTEANLGTLARVILEIERTERPGIIIEAGTARGGSAIVMASAKASSRPMLVYDVFGMIPPPSEHDGPDVHGRYDKIVQGRSSGISGETYYGYRDNLYDEVTDSFGRLGFPVGENNVQLVQGLFQDTIEGDEPVALAHLDGDWYESTMTCLERISPRLVPGGRLVLDDYYAWSGCRTAVEEYFANRPGYQVERRIKVHVVRL